MTSTMEDILYFYKGITVRDSKFSSVIRKTLRKIIKTFEETFKLNSVK